MIGTWVEWWSWLAFVEWLTDKRRLVFISSRHLCQRFSPSQITNTLQTRFENAQNLSSDFVEWSCTFMITTKPRCLNESRRQVWRTPGPEPASSLEPFFFHLGFLSRTFTNHRTAREGGGYFFNSSLPLPPASQTLDISWAITAESSPLHIASSRARTRNLWFPSGSR